jgi:hypothetical protein
MGLEPTIFRLEVGRLIQFGHETFLHPLTLSDIIMFDFFFIKKNNYSLNICCIISY